MVVYYKNSKGECIGLLKKPYRTVDADWYDADWTINSSGYEKTVKIDVFGDRKEFVENMEHLYKVLGYDADNGLYGRLYVNGTFLPCRLKKSKKTNWKGYLYTVVEMTFIAPKLEWITEKYLQFYPQKSTRVNDGMNFPFNFPINFALAKKGYETIEIDNTTASEFQLVVYGPCMNPRILINDYPYEVFCSLEKDEYMILDSKNYTITKYLTNGSTANLFNERGLEYSVFEKIPSGTLAINWSGEFGFDLILFMKRGEARW